MTIPEILALVPQQRPFRFLDELVEIDAEHAIGRCTFSPDEWFYRGHFPGNPVTPGVILLEAMCQTGLVALGLRILSDEVPVEELRRSLTLFTDAQVEFDRVVGPGETLRIEAQRLSWRRRKLRSRVEMFGADGVRVAGGTVSGMGVIR